MTKSELIEKISESLKLPAGKAELIVNCVFDSMVKAVETHSPALVWLSFSFITDEADFVHGFQRLSAVASHTNTAIVVGGRALTFEIRTRLSYSAFCDTMRHLEEFGKTLRRQTDSTPKKSHKTGKKA